MEQQPSNTDNCALQAADCDTAISWARLIVTKGDVRGETILEGRVTNRWMVAKCGGKEMLGGFKGGFRDEWVLISEDRLTGKYPTRTKDGRPYETTRLNRET